MFPQGDAHVISSAPGIQPTRFSADWVYTTRNDPKAIPIVFHAPNEFSYGAPAPESPTNVACGFLGCDLRPFNPLIAALSRLLHLPAASDRAWISQVMRHAVKASQNKRPGGEAVLERISEMMFVDAVRRLQVRSRSPPLLRRKFIRVWRLPVPCKCALTLLSQTGSRVWRRRSKSQKLGKRRKCVKQRK